MGIRTLLCILAAISLASADTLTLRDGRIIQGQYLGGSARQVRIAVGDSVQTFDVMDISNLQFEAGKQAPAAAPAPPSATVVPAAPVAVTAPTAPTPATAPTATAPVTAPEAARAPAGEQGKILHVEPATPPPAAPVKAMSGEIPSGAAITIRMIDAVDSKESRPGQTFKATVDDPVMDGDRVLVPKGADVVTKLVEVKDPNKITGGGQLTLSLASVFVNGRMVDVNSESVTTTGESRKGDSAKVIGGTAALGAIIGAIAGGGKGAAIGAVSGAGAGTAVRVLTKGAEVKIPSETRLTFTLQSPVKL
jgi:hypothetical protein